MRSKKAICNILTNLVLQIIIVIYGFIIPKIIISSYGSNVNGLISSITQFLSYITLLESGFGPVVKAALYKPIANKDNITIANILKSSEKFFRNIAKIFLVYIVVLLFTYPIFINSDFEYFYTSSLIVIISISIFAEYFFGMTYKLYIQANQENYIIYIIQIVTYIINIVIILILAKYNASIQIIKLASTIAFVLRPIVQNIYVKTKYNIHFSNINNNYKLKQKWDGLAQHIAAVIHGNTDITILTFFCSLSEVSVYSVYYLVVRGIKSVIEAFMSGIDSSFGDMIAREEQDNLNDKFQIYEVFYFTICTIVFTCTMILIIPFISVYTRDFTDVNYIRQTFGYLIVISEYVWAIRLPYSSIIMAAGHFKETRIGAWIEAVTNIVISILFVVKYGIVGVAIGTIVAMFIRTLEFVFHSNKTILHRNVKSSIKKINIMAFQTILLVFVSKYLFFFPNLSYLYLIMNSIIIFAFVSIFILFLNFVLYKKEFDAIVLIIKKIVKKNNQ